MSVPVHKYITGETSVQITGSIESAIRDGRLDRGQRLPTVRSLAGSLGVSPTTVSAAYRRLRERGLLSGRSRRGTVVAAAPPVATPFPAPIPEGVRDLATGNPDPALLPDLKRALARVGARQRLYGPGLKSPQLLALAARRFDDDGVASQCLAVTSGALDGVERVLQAHLRPGDRVLVEDPGFVGVLDLLGALGLIAMPVAVDDEGVLPDELARAASDGAQALIITPRAQNPMGSAMDAARARELRRVLRGHPDLLVVEDDHAAGVAGVPFETLCGKDRRHWAVARSVAKSLGPDLRIAILAGDRETIARVEGRQLLGIRWVSHILQELVTVLWSDRGIDRRLRAAERTYSERRRTLIDALASHGIDAHGASGLNVWVPVAEETAVVQRLRDAGWAVSSGERFRSRSAPAIRVTCAALQPADARAFAADFAAAVRPASAATIT